MNTSFPFCSTENGTVKFAVRKCSERSFSFITISSAKNIPMAASWMDEETYKLTDLWSIDAIQAMLCHTLINCFFFFCGSVGVGWKGSIEGKFVLMFLTY